MSHDHRRPGYIEPHRRHLDPEDQYWTRRRRLNRYLTWWAIAWLLILVAALIVGAL